MPTPAKIYFLYRQSEGWTARDTTVEEAEKDIRYWLGKSPGIHEIEEIMVVANENLISYAWLVLKIAMENAAADVEIQEREERATFERLKAKFEK